jgi:hypothetical protein
MNQPLKDSRDRSKVPCTADSATAVEQSDADALQKKSLQWFVKTQTTE